MISLIRNLLYFVVTLIRALAELVACILLQQVGISLEKRKVGFELSFDYAARIMVSEKR